MVFSLFRKRFDKVVAKADSLYDAGQLGLARGEYADALGRFREGQDDPAAKARVEERLKEICIGLAQKQIDQGAKFQSIQNFEDARGCFEAAYHLAEQAGDEGLMNKADQAMDDLGHAIEHSTTSQRALDEAMAQAAPPVDDPDAEFALLISTFKPAREDAYEALGPHFRDGYLALNDGKADKALKCFNKVEDQTSPWLAYEKGRVWQLKGKTNEAMQAFRKAADALEGEVAQPVLTHLAQAALDNKRWDDASAAVERFAELEGGKHASDEVVAMRVAIMRGQGKTNEAIEALRARLKQTPSALTLWRLLGIIYEEAERPGEAIEAYEQVMSLRWRFIPERKIVDCDPFAASRLASLLYERNQSLDRAGQVAAALTLLMDVGSRFEPLILQAQILAKQGKADQGRTLIQEEMERARRANAQQAFTALKTALGQLGAG